MPGFEVGAVDVLVPAAGVHALAVGREGETRQWCCGFVDGDFLAGLEYNVSGLLLFFP